jgi:hypothetical protein
MANVLVFPRMPHAPEQRRQPDRRRLPRGGRRAADRSGYAPLVLLVDEDAEAGEACEAILLKLRFAVAPARNVADALKILTGLRPDVIVARSADAARLRMEVPGHIPVVAADETVKGDALVEKVRATLRSRKRI